ncbi:hypothetical protein ABZ038_12670 [Streptomyces sp. NPDC006349]
MESDELCVVVRIERVGAVRDREKLLWVEGWIGLLHPRGRV